MDAKAKLRPKGQDLGLSDYGRGDQKSALILLLVCIYLSFSIDYSYAYVCSLDEHS